MRIKLSNICVVKPKLDIHLYICSILLQMYEDETLYINTISLCQQNITTWVWSFKIMGEVLLTTFLYFTFGII